jgi:hypothetical protein
MRELIRGLGAPEPLFDGDQTKSRNLYGSPFWISLAHGRPLSNYISPMFALSRWPVVIHER